MYSYRNSMDRDYNGGRGQSLNPSDPRKFSITDFGQSVTEGSRFGTFLQSAQAAIRHGTVNVELQLNLGGGAEPVGADSYGKEAREALREISKINQVKFSAVHAPSNIGNVSGFNPESGFSDQQRLFSVDEIKKAVKFSADVAGGGAVVVHTGEFQRSMEGASWNKDHQFLTYQEEPGRAIKYLVDSRTGRLQADIRKSQIYIQPVYLTAQKEGWGTDVAGNRVFIKKGDYVDDEGRFINPRDPEQLSRRVPKWDPKSNTFESQKLTWNEIEQRTQFWNERYRKEGERELRPEEYAFRIQAENAILQNKGNALFYSRQYEEVQRRQKKLKEALAYWKNVEENSPKSAVRDMMRQDPIFREPELQSLTGDLYDPANLKKPSEILAEALREGERNVQYIHEGAAAADARAKEVAESLNFVVPMEDYAKKQSARSYAELGIYAMQESKNNPHVKKDIFLAAENIFPEMGYGSHPEELIELIKEARKEMVRLLTSKKIEDPHAVLTQDGKPKLVDNPFYHSDISKKEAEKIAEQHIKATFDTQHLSMWRKYFQPKFNERSGRMETPDETDNRFKKWYMEQVDKLGKSGVLGHLHLVDSFGSGHQHLPGGQGMWPVIDAVKKLRAMGYDGAITSEGFGEGAYGQERIITKVWEAFDSPVHGSGYPVGAGGMGGGRFGAPSYWTDVSQSYFGRIVPPNFIFGAYSPSNEWRLWSEVPLE